MTSTPGSNALAVQPGANAMAANHGNAAYLNSQAVALKQQQYIQRQQLIAEQVVTLLGNIYEYAACKLEFPC